MMMAAIYAGQQGLDLLVAPQMEQANPKFEGYQSNPNGLYEVGLVRYMEPRFLRKLPDDSVVKILYDGLPILPSGDYKVVFMTRDKYEILASEDRVKKHFDAYTEATGAEHIDHEQHTKLLPFCSLRPYNLTDIEHVLGICDMRNDFDITIINYAAVIDTPTEVFTRMRDDGWPIDPEKCAATIDKSLYRVRKTA